MLDFLSPTTLIPSTTGLSVKKSFDVEDVEPVSVEPDLLDVLDVPDVLSLALDVSEVPTAPPVAYSRRNFSSLP